MKEKSQQSANKYLKFKLASIASTPHSKRPEKDTCNWKLKYNK